MLGVGTTTVVSHAAGRKDHEQALLLFNQSQVLAMVTGGVFLRAVGVAGAAMSSLVAVAIGVAWLATYFLPRDSYLRFEVGRSIELTNTPLHDKITPQSTRGCPCAS